MQATLLLLHVKEDKYGELQKNVKRPLHAFLSILLAFSLPSVSWHQSGYKSLARMCSKCFHPMAHATGQCFNLARMDKTC